MKLFRRVLPVLGQRNVSTTTFVAAEKCSNRLLRFAIRPVPVTFAERRAALQVLEQYGKIQMFKMAEGPNGLGSTITESEATAKTLVSSSPIVYVLPTEKKNKDLGSKTRATAEEESEDDEQQFVLQIDWNTPLRVAREVSRELLNKNWPLGYLGHRSLSQKVLTQTLPPNLLKTGLTYWGMDLTKESMTKELRLHKKRILPSQMKMKPAQTSDSNKTLALDDEEEGLGFEKGLHRTSKPSNPSISQGEKAKGKGQKGVAG